MSTSDWAILFSYSALLIYLYITSARHLLQRITCCVPCAFFSEMKAGKRAPNRLHLRSKHRRTKA